jgi:hypothetical protein
MVDNVKVVRPMLIARMKSTMIIMMYYFTIRHSVVASFTPGGVCFFRGVSPVLFAPRPG